MVANRLSRRSFLRVAGVGSAALLGGGLTGLGRLGRASSGMVEPTPTSHPHRSLVTAESFLADADIAITAAEKTVQILPGASTRVWAYEGKLLSRSGAAVQAVPNSFSGPILRVKSGTKLRLRFHNNLPQESVIHPHGLRVPEYCDGSPMDAIGPGQTSIYEFQVIDRAGPYWFHPHPMTTTPEQVYLGMAGLFYVWDDEEEKVVPGAGSGENDIPVIIQDRTFDRSNQLLYQPNMMWGLLGDRILVNGTLDAICGLEPRGYRLRILNGSNARTYKLAWSNGMSLQVIGSDGGLLPKVVSRSYVLLMPGERVDVWADFKDLPGQKIKLTSLPFEAGMGMMGMHGMGMGMMGGGLPNGSPLEILTINVGKTASTAPVLGTLPPLSDRYDARNVPNFAAPQPVILGMGMMMSWTINGLQYEEQGLAAGEMVVAGEPLAWEFINLSPIPHPMHLHNVQFQVLERISPATASYASINQGFVDDGWKDTVAVWPGERVKIAMKFGPHMGMYMYHCHILEHEDMGMMRNLMIVDEGM